MAALRTWDPWSIFSTKSSSCFALVLLNQKPKNSELLLELWNRSQYRVTVDGGVNIWRAQCVGNIVEQKFPDLITGDMDSADGRFVEYFKGLGSKVVHTPDQDHTDFTKALIELDKMYKEGEPKVAGIQAVIAFVETGGRMDHVMGNIQTLALASTLVPDLPPTFLCSSESLSWMLPAGAHSLPLPTGVRPQHCGLLPVLGDTVITTTGLKWNLTKGRLRFGEMVSTSNGFRPESSEVTVVTDKDVLWTMDLPLNGMCEKKSIEEMAQEK